MAYILGSLAASACSSSDGGAPDARATGAVLAVVSGDDLVRFDVGTGERVGDALAGFAGAPSPVALAPRTLLVAAPATDEIVTVDVASFAATARMPASSGAARAPAAVLVAPAHDGRTKVAVLNAGSGAPVTSSVRLLDELPDGSLHGYAEVFLSGGAHAAAFSTRLERIVVTSDDCDALAEVIDYADAGRIRTVATLAAGDVGLDADVCAAALAVSSRPPPACAPLGTVAVCGLPGIATVAVTLDAAAPSWTKLLGAESAGLAAGVDAGASVAVLATGAPFTVETFRAPALPPAASVAVAAAPGCAPADPLAAPGGLYLFFGCSGPAFLVAAQATPLTVGAGTVARTSAALGTLAAVANDLDGTVTLLGDGAPRAFAVGGTPTGLIFLD